MDHTFKGHKAHNQQKKAQNSRNNYSFCISTKKFQIECVFVLVLG